MTKHYEAERINKVSGKVIEKITFSQDDYDMFYKNEISFLNNNDNFTTIIYLVIDTNERIVITRLNKSVKLNAEYNTKNTVYVKLTTSKERCIKRNY